MALRLLARCVGAGRGAVSMPLPPDSVCTKYSEMFVSLIPRQHTGIYEPATLSMPWVNTCVSPEQPMDVMTAFARCLT